LVEKKFGNQVKPGKKAIFIPAGGDRRDCDVLPATQYRYYYRFNSMADELYAEGICFWVTDGTQIVNFPKQHAANCTAKHQGTTQRFKPTIRVFKNMRNYLVDSNKLSDGIAPSYFIEGLLHNVPNDKFVASHDDTFVAVFNYLAQTDRSDFKCANGFIRCCVTIPTSLGLRRIARIFSTLSGSFGTIGGDIRGETAQLPDAMGPYEPSETGVSGVHPCMFADPLFRFKRLSR
jgi:hypothetical protein